MSNTNTNKNHSPVSVVIDDEKGEVGEILVRLHAGVISKEEAQTQLDKFSTSPSRIIEHEQDYALGGYDSVYDNDNDDDDDDDDDVRRGVNLLTRDGK